MYYRTRDSKKETYGVENFKKRKPIKIIDYRTLKKNCENCLKFSVRFRMTWPM